ncbi:hypothetical protein PBY51_014321 [Eleginops maclovinus]|uniref:Uncharacterized protein n=1 Tax=Eleginops maclovinus TaxID=56733 RepID=A0AAN7WWQ5_ELEMC|nr:hypothetical protein PBY51_014321 [Eleginops maclovinus]
MVYYKHTKNGDLVGAVSDVLAVQARSTWFGPRAPTLVAQTETQILVQNPYSGRTPLPSALSDLVDLEIGIQTTAEV